ncbi:TAXI family TRAP transporter solute-binding subunit [Streptomyces sp. NPDC003247]|uniref:TAXI family TRAP transporter solute-binding subunit n=1 Tax=Streptomyces sp. NPDC003247 TaxID=3364677 RepID=UPI003698036C
MTRPRPRPHDRPQPVDRRTVLHAALGTAAAAVLGGVLTADTSRQRPGPSGVLRFATGEPTAFYEAFGRLLATELHAAHPRLSCRVRTTAGSVTNIALLRDRRADLALVLTDTARAALGTALFPHPVPLRAIGRVYETYLQFVVRADSPVRAVSDLAGHTVSLGAAGSGAAVLGERILHAAGLTPGTDVPVLHLPLADAADAMRAGSVDALLVAGGVPLPVLSDLDDRPGLRFLPLAGLLPRLGPVAKVPPAWRRHARTLAAPAPDPSTSSTRARGRHAESTHLTPPGPPSGRTTGLSQQALGGADGRAGSGLEEVTLPQSAYRTAGGVATIGVSNLLVSRPDLPRAVAEALTRLLVLRASALVPDNAVGTQFLDVGSLIGTGAVPLHPGAAAAYRALHG